MKNLLYVGTFDDSRTELYKSTLNLNAEFNYEILSWSQYLKLENLSGIDIIRFSSPWFEKDLSNLIANSNYVLENNLDKELVDNNFYQILDKATDIAKGVEVLNPLNSIKIMRNKIETFNLLDSQNITTPRIFNFNSLEDVLVDLEFDSQFFIKPKTGSLGVGLSMLSKNNKGEINYKIITGKDDEDYFGNEAIDKLNFNLSNFSEYLFQDYIKCKKINNFNFDMRVLVNQDLDSQFSYIRISESGSLGTNISLGGRSIFDVENYIPKSSLLQVRSLVKETARVFSNSIFGVDIIFDENFKPYVLESNAFPGIKSPLQVGYNPYKIEINKINNILKK